MSENQQNIEAHAFTREVCRGDPSAIQFCDLFYTYCHAIDDLLDTIEDGRPTMPKEEILAIFINAALLYNCPFYLAHRANLFPTVITVTNLYADSVAWERDPRPHRRAMADVLRCCGDEMMLMVAMITGGWKHMRSLSPRIRETDWLRQHDKDGNPT